MVAGRERSRAALRRGPLPGAAPSRNEVLRAHVVWLAAWARDLPPRRRKLLIGIGLFLHFDLIAGIAAVTMGTHF